MPKLFDMFEAFMLTITFSYQSLEVFSNWEIANKLKSPFTLKRKGKSYELSPPDLVRFASTGEKLSKVLPSVLSVEHLRGVFYGNDSARLRDARDSIIHLKAEQPYTRNVDNESLFFYVL